MIRIRYNVWQLVIILSIQCPFFSLIEPTITMIILLFSVESSDSSDDDEEVMWHEQRRKLKETLAKGGKAPVELKKIKR